MAQEVGKPVRSALPAYLQGKQKEHVIGNIDQTDLVIPRIKLLQSGSPEVEQFDAAKSGEFWHTVLQESLGKSIVGIPIVLRKTQVLWAPRGDDRGILARSRDGVNWDPPRGEFKVKFKGNPKEYTWKLAPTVAESGLDQFGSSRDDDPESPPASALTYEILWWFPDAGMTKPAIVLNSRGSVNVCKRLLSVIDAKPADHFYQMYSINSVVAKGPTNENYFGYQYISMGFAEEEDGEKARKMFEYYKDVAFRASDERSDDSDGAAPNGGRSRGPTQRSADSKF